MTLIPANKAEEIVDAAMAHLSVNRWYVPGTRARAIEAAVAAKSAREFCDRLTDIFAEGEIDDPGGDPCDECRGDKWFYYHPALVL